eukprot:jgi/Tetstr1/454628/TSEL_041520.t1
MSAAAATIRVWDGRLSLRQLQLDPNAVDRLGLPLACTKVHVELLEAQISWRCWGMRSIQLRLSGLSVGTKLRSHMQSYGASRQRKPPKPAEPPSAAQARASVLPLVDDVLLGAANSPAADAPSVIGRLRLAVLQALLRHLVCRLHVCLSVLSFTLDIDRPDATKAVSGLEECGTVAVELEVGRVLWDGAEATAVQGLASTLAVEGVLCSVRKGSAWAGPEGRQASQRPRVVLKRWNLRVGVAWGGALGLPGSTDVQLHAGALLLALDRFSLATLLVAAKCVSRHARFARYRAFRPGVSVRANPRAWWKHAISATLRELELLRHRRLTRLAAAGWGSPP